MNTKRKTLEFAEKIIQAQIKSERSRWPHCIGILHQPKRPVSKSNEK